MSPTINVNPIPAMPLLPALPPVSALPDPDSLPALTQAETDALQEECRLMQHPLHDRLLAQEITPDTVITKRHFLFTLFGKPCFAKGELVAVTGKAKSGKTFLCSSLITSALRGECLGISRQSDQSHKVLWIDTEQSEESTQEILIRRIQVQVNGTDQLDLFPSLPKVYNLRAIPWDQRLQFIEAAIQIHRPDLVIFDGIRDVVSDINDGVMAQQVVEHVMQLAGRFSACIVCVLHQNKAAEDSTLRGALGTELQNKCFESYECKKQDGIFTIEQIATRKYDIRDKLYFTVAPNGLPVPSAMTQTPDAQTATDTNPYHYYKDGKRMANVPKLLVDIFSDTEVRIERPVLIDKMTQLLQGTPQWSEKLIEGIAQRGQLIVHTAANGLVYYSRRA